jgi:hypothetical protein
VIKTSVSVLFDYESYLLLVGEDLPKRLRWIALQDDWWIAVVEVERPTTILELYLVLDEDPVLHVLQGVSLAEVPGEGGAVGGPEGDVDGVGRRRGLRADGQF